MPGPGEPLWTPDDAEKALAWVEHLRAEAAAVCGRCGTRRSDWVDEQGRRWVEPAWLVETETCPGCEAVDAAVSMVPDGRRDLTVVRLRPASSDDFLDRDE